MYSGISSANFTLAVSTTTGIGRNGPAASTWSRLTSKSYCSESGYAAICAGVRLLPATQMRHSSGVIWARSSGESTSTNTMPFTSAGMLGREDAGDVAGEGVGGQDVRAMHVERVEHGLEVVGAVLRVWWAAATGCCGSASRRGTARPGRSQAHTRVWAPMASKTLGSWPGACHRSEAVPPPESSSTVGDPSPWHST